MQWADFGPYVDPYVIGCPEPVLVHHARLAAIDFARRTQCWKVMLEPVMANGSDTYIEVEKDPYTDISRCLIVNVGGENWPTVDAHDGYTRLLQNGNAQTFAFLDTDSDVLHVSPPQPKNTRVEIMAALVPSLNSPELAKPLEQYAQDISHGIIARIMLIPTQTFTNPKDAAVHQALFNGRITTIASKISLGRMDVHLRGSRGFL